MGWAQYSKDMKYRYILGRDLGMIGSGTVLFIMLNPSTATACVSDPTITRCISYAKRWGYAAIEVVNLFAYRATSPERMKAQFDPIGPGNDEHILRAVDRSALAIAAWGATGTFKGRSDAVEALITRRELYCLDLTKDGQPKHPLYLPKNLSPITLRLARKAQSMGGLELHATNKNHGRKREVDMLDRASDATPGRPIYPRPTRH